jgi:hypothetical protein
MLSTVESTVRNLGAAVTNSRATWNGGLSEDEMGKPGGPLMAALLYRADQLGHTLAQMADEMGVTYGYIAQLQSGRRAPESISPQFIDAAAAYLGVPSSIVLLLSSGNDKAGPGRAN